MQEYKEGNLTFRFNDDWIIETYENWIYYKNQFQKVKGGGVKAVDFIARSPVNHLWLI